MTAEKLVVPSGGSTLEISALLSPYNPPFIDPKYGWSFPYLVEGATNGNKRFKVYAQSHTQIETSKLATRMLLRVWDQCQFWKIDHPLTYDRLVHVYFCEGGKPGGEQLFITTPGGQKFNAIYIFDMRSFLSPLEKARELAHEYGHAVLPPIKGFTTPEEWGNGYLGEKLFLDALIHSPDFQKEDAMDCEKGLIKSWITQNAQPTVYKIWSYGPDIQQLSKTGKKSLDEYIGVNLYFYKSFPAAFARGLKLAGGQTAIDSLNGFMLALEEKSEWKVEIPKPFLEKLVWIPFGKQWNLNAKAIASKNGWSQIKPVQSTLTIKRN